ncbi:hypothetical protein A3C98_03620 [Candidatus Roizmanbacteria bacterium RIFCSPHIGHO2_02_FULL_37_15]|uniref:Uncharacterized protein n=1 Tax=Candidatus Roizmanbacteria bacterium RIFCSPLOWO2_01_FULL_37_16 TaxID=1802058 RepID=A0A1F7IIY3_9BACT|nr:MAG: hypothetical protein A2859_05110 [Candidatus Roizmanbacteria bacterium RIFCSPHIGHO2_01_FULL_37_16b]OGK20458.1 MAG: hypothetical protein A3C98_03620 [Candidatus Roizmanbacteria bacterium RIFCSPHIGHO2_02_FULL_37_15]OGK43310.1 MAG: hypothetical protein A3B40_02360 [Candidatus Roizmanbacteria bacterium RIFCSPLOWO2_01_FULL_37_16]
MPKEKFSLFPKPKLRQPSLPNALARRLVVGLLNTLPIAPAEVYNVDYSLQQASDLLRNGYKLWILGTHFSKREGPELAVRPAQYIAGLTRRPIVLPISLHQYFENQISVDLLSRITAVTILPVVNDDVMREENRLLIEAKLGRSPEKGEGARHYARLVNRATSQGGIAGIAPQAGRRQSLELSQAEVKAVEYLLALNRTQEHDKLAFLFMSMIPTSKVDFGKIYQKYNLGMVYKIVFLTLKLAKMYDLLAKMNLELTQNPIEPGKFQITLDELALIILSLPIDSDYNKINPGYAALLTSLEGVGSLKAMTEVR